MTLDGNGGDAMGRPTKSKCKELISKYRGRGPKQIWPKSSGKWQKMAIRYRGHNGKHSEQPVTLHTPMCMEQHLWNEKEEQKHLCNQQLIEHQMDGKSANIFQQHWSWPCCQYVIGSQQQSQWSWHGSSKINLHLLWAIRHDPLQKTYATHSKKLSNSCPQVLARGQVPSFTIVVSINVLTAGRG